MSSIDKSNLLTSGREYGHLNEGNSLQIDGTKIYEVKMFNKPYGISLESGALGHVVTGLDDNIHESQQVALYSRLQRIDGIDVGASTRKDVDALLSKTEGPITFVFERPERWDVLYNTSEVDFTPATTEFGNQLCRVEDGGETQENGVPLGAHIAMVNGDNLIYKPQKDVTEALKNAIFPARITFVVFGTVITQDGSPVITSSHGGIGSAEGREERPSGAGAVAVQSNPRPTSALRRMERKEKYPILKVGEFCSFFFVFLGMVLVCVAISIEHLVHLRMEYDDDVIQYDTNGNVIVGAEKVDLWYSDHHIHFEATLKNDSIVFDYPDKEICNFPTNDRYYKALEAEGKEGFFASLCNEGRVWKNTAITAVVFAAILVLAGAIALAKDIPVTDTTYLIEWIWGPALMITVMIVLIKGIGMLVYTINGVNDIASVEEETCLFVRQELYATDPSIAVGWEKCSAVGGWSIWLGSTALTLWLIATCCMCMSWLNTPRTCCYVGDNE